MVKVGSRAFATPSPHGLRLLRVIPEIRDMCPECRDIPGMGDYRVKTAQVQSPAARQLHRAVQIEIGELFRRQDVIVPRVGQRPFQGDVGIVELIERFLVS